MGGWREQKTKIAGAWRWMRRCFPSSPTSYGTIEEENKHTNIEGLVTLFAFFVTQLVAGLYFVQGKDIPALAFILYGLLGLVTLIAMGVIVGSPKTAEGTAMYAHDRGTVAVGKWFIGCSLLLLILFVGLGSANMLPGQGAEAIKVVHAEAFDESPDKLPWLKLEIPVRPDQFGGRVPTSFKLLAQSNDLLKKNWQPVQAQLFRITPDRWKERILEYPEIDPTTDPAEVMVVHVPVPDYVYLLELFMKPSSVDVTAFNKLDGEEKEAKLKELLTLRDGAIQEIMARGGVQLSWQR
jgi:hypothetical protein